MKALLRIDSKIRISQLIGVTGLSLMIMVFLTTCEDLYSPNLNNKYNEVLVVDGMITNAEPPYTVKLSLSSDVQTSERVRLSGYLPRILDDQGNVEVLTEIEPGTYSSSVDGMNGIVGRSYKIIMQSPDGKIYESDFEELKEPVGIEAVYPELEYVIADEYPYNIPGYRFIVDTYTANSDSTYLLWSMDETYKYEADYLIYFYYDGILHTFSNSDSLITCWKTGKVQTFYVDNTVGLSVPRFTHYPLHFVDTRTRRLSIRYSLLVHQYTINKKAYNFWNVIKAQNSEIGDLYSRQPYQLRGNIYNQDDKDELVMGYFMVAGLSQKRIFVDRPNPTIGMNYSICELTKNDYDDYAAMFLGGPLSSWPLYVTMDANGGRALPNQECIDCTQSGGSLEKPDFWEDFVLKK